MSDNWQPSALGDSSLGGTSLLGSTLFDAAPAGSSLVDGPVSKPLPNSPSPDGGAADSTGARWQAFMGRQGSAPRVPARPPGPAAQSTPSLPEWTPGNWGDPDGEPAGAYPARLQPPAPAPGRAPAGLSTGFTPPRQPARNATVSPQLQARVGLGLAFVGVFGGIWWSILGFALSLLALSRASRGEPLAPRDRRMAQFAMVLAVAGAVIFVVALASSR